MGIGDFIGDKESITQHSEGGDMTTEQLREKIARIVFDNKHTIGENSWYWEEPACRSLSNKILKACKEAGIVMLSDDQSGLPTYLVDAPHTKRVIELP